MTPRARDVTSTNQPFHAAFSRRERQIMDILFRRGRATASEVQDELPDQPSSSTVRTQLRVLEEKGHVRHVEEGLRFVYQPVASRRAARQSAMRHLLHTFFEGSAEQAVAALLGGEGTRVTDAELHRIEQLVLEAKRAQSDPVGTKTPQPVRSTDRTRGRRRS